MMHAKEFGYQLIIGRNERRISNVWLIQSPERVAGYFKCMPAFLGKIQWAAWCPQQLAPNSWQLLHMPLRRVPALHQGLVSCLNLPWRMTLMISKETVSKGTHVRHSKREMLSLQFKWLFRNRLNLLWHGHCGFHEAWGLCAHLHRQEPVPTTCPQPQHRSTVSRATFHLHFLKLLCSEIKLCLRGFNALNVIPVCITDLLII